MNFIKHSIYLAAFVVASTLLHSCAGKAEKACKCLESGSFQAKLSTGQIRDKHDIAIYLESCAGKQITADANRYILNDKVMEEMYEVCPETLKQIFH